MRWLPLAFAITVTAIASVLQGCGSKDENVTDAMDVADADGASDDVNDDVMDAAGDDATDATPPSTKRRYTPGHYVAISRSQQRAAGGVPNPGVVSNAGPVATGVKGLVLRYYWNELEPNGVADSNRFVWTRPDKEIAQCKALGVQLVMLIVVKTFDGTNPAPHDLESYATYFNTRPTPAGFIMWRWNATVLARFKDLVDAIGKRYDANPNFAGIATQETATGAVTDGGYTPASYLAALESESDYIAKASPSSRHFAFENFIQGVSNSVGTTMLGEYAAHIQPNGAIFGGPDLVMSGAILTRVYPNYTLYHDGTSPVPSPGPTFCSVQNAEWSGIPPAVPRSMQDLFDYGRGAIADDDGGKPLHLDIIMWDWHPAATGNNGGQKFNPDAASIIAAHPTFGTFTPP